MGSNDGPIPQGDYALVAEDGQATGSVAANDVDPDRHALLSFAPTGSPVPGFFMASDGSWTFDASAPEYQAFGVGETHQMPISYKVTDEHGATSEAYLLVSVTGANDAPVVLGTVQNGFVLEDGPTVSGQIGFDDADFLDVHGASVARLGAGPAFGGITIDGFQPRQGLGIRTLDWHYAPGPGLQSLDEGEQAVESFAITISDGHGGTATQIVNVRVTGSGDAPVATAAVATVPEDTILNASLSPFASDVDHHSLLRFSTGAATAGFALAPDGSWTFDARNAAYQALNAGETMAVVVPYTVTDPTGRTGSSTLTITVQGANDSVVTASPPVFTGAGDPNDFDNLLGPGAVDNALAIVASPAGGTITGAAAAQTITGSDSSDTIYGGGGNDVINGRGNGDRLYGQAGADTLDAGWGTDILYGGSGNDILRGQTPQAEAISGTWPITLYGGSGSDTLVGGGNNDILVGGYGADTMTGGGNLDTFVFNSTLDTGDRITDFLYGVDKLDFRGIDANSAIAGDQAFLWSHNGAAANSLWAVQQGADTVIFGDTDGNLNTAEFMLTLQNQFFIEPSGSPAGFML
jgi:VCBS repeat-containing protein